jgi:hypothetical protein
MKRIFSVFAILTIIALFNMGGCGGRDDENNGYKPVIDKIVFYQSSEKNNPTDKYTQGTDGVITVTMSDYDLNLETIEMMIYQCADATCNNYTVSGPYIFSLLEQTNIEITYSINNMINSLSASFYYNFVFEATDKKGQCGTANKMILIDKGKIPVIEELYFYNERIPEKRLDTWKSKDDYYYFVAVFKAKDVDINSRFFYISRTCLKLTNESLSKPEFDRLGPIEFSEDDMNQPEMIINIKEYLDDTSTKYLIEDIQDENLEGLYEIKITIEDALGNTADIAKNLTYITQ